MAPHLSVQHGDEQRLQGAAAETELFQALLPEALTSDDGAKALADALTRSAYLQQDLVRDFIDAQSEVDRFSAVSELVGAGRVTELQLQLDRERTAWSRRTNDREVEVERLRTRWQELRQRIERIEASPSDFDPGVAAAWDAWWPRVAQVTAEVRSLLDPASSEATVALEQAMREVASRQRALERRRLLAEELASELQATPDSGDIVNALKEARASEQEAVAAAAETRTAVDDERRRAAESRRISLQAYEEREQLRALAQLALEHLGERCPVCTQTYDRPGTIARLQALAELPQAPVVEDAGSVALNRLLVDLEVAEAHAAEASARAAALDTTARTAAIRQRDLRERLEALGVGDSDDPVGAVSLPSSMRLPKSEQHWKTSDAVARSSRFGSCAPRRTRTQKGTGDRHVSGVREALGGRGRP